MDCPLLERMQDRKLAMSEVSRVRVGRNISGLPVLGFTGSWDSLRFLEQVPGATYRPHGDLWLPANRTSILLLETLGRLEVATPDYLNTRRRLLASPSTFLPLYPPAPAGQPVALPHQKDAFCYAMEAFHEGWRGFGNWSEMGTGKTRAAIDLARVVGERAVLIVGQNSTIPQWEGELTHLWDDAEVIPLLGSLKDREQEVSRVARSVRCATRPFVLVTNWEALWRLKHALSRVPWDLAVFDESSRAKNRTSQMSRAAREIGRRCHRRLALSGTPVGNSPGDLWAQYDLLDPGIFDCNYRTFMHRYFHLGGHMGDEFESFRPESIAHFVEKIYTIGFRVTKATVADMPPKLYRTQDLPMTPEQRRLYTRISRHYFSEEVLADGSSLKMSVGHAMARVLRLQQICAGIMPFNTISWTEKEIREEEEGKHPHELFTSGKTLWTGDFCKEQVRDTDGKILIWTRFIPEIRGLLSQLTSGQGALTQGEFGWIDGKVSRNERERLRKAFNDRSGELRVLICQIQAAAYGLDLPAADILIYHSQSFSYSDRSQSEDRGHRIGRIRPYQVIDLVLEDSIDSVVLRAIRKKQDLAAHLMQAGGVSLKALHKEKAGV